MAMVAAATETRYREIARRLIAREHYTVIADALGITPATLYWHMRKPAFRAILHEMDERIFEEVDQALGDGSLDITKRIAMVQNEAFETIVHLMRFGRSDRIKKECAMDVLDRGGNVAVQKSQTEHKIELREISIKMLAVAFKESEDATTLQPDYKTLDDAMKSKDDDAAA